MPTTDELKQRIEASIPGAVADVIDLNGTGDHFRARSSRREFAGLSRIEQHRRVYAVFGADIGGPIHALSLVTRAAYDTMSTVEQQISEEIQKAISGNEVILFMKGTPEAPRCGFSARTVAALEALGTPFAAVDILPDPRIRQQLSALSNWPTIPQLFVKRRADRRRRHRRGDVRVRRARRGPRRRPRRPGAAPEGDANAPLTIENRLNAR